MAFFDFTDGNICFESGKKLMTNANGDIMHKLSSHSAIDLNTGEIHLGSFGSSLGDEEEDQYF